MDYHLPVLLKQTIELLDPKPGKCFIDATLGHGGHAQALLTAGATVFGIDQDPLSIQTTISRLKQQNLDQNFFPIQGNFSNLASLYSSEINQPIDGILFDLGLNSTQQKLIGRGFSFNDHQSLDMRLDTNSQVETAENIINTYDFTSLFEIFTKYAQEKYSKPLILRIIKERQKSPIKTGQRLAEIIRDFYQERHLRTSIDPATKIFMALRIAVNLEYDHLRSALEQTLSIVKPKGVVCVITFHSGEDRIVKNFIQKSKLSLQVTSLTPKGVRADFTEIRSNPLARSATLRSYRIN